MSIDLVRKPYVFAIATVLLVILAAELILSVRQESQTFDESAHLYADYAYWKQGDFGINPEHLPLIKLVAALPLLSLPLPVPPAPDIYFRAVSLMGGRQFLYEHNADALLFRARMAAGVFTIVLALLIAIAGWEMFGAGAALLLFVFEPNVLGHGALITTDMGVACCFFASVYTFYCKTPGIAPLLISAIVVGFTLAAKHSGLLVPVVILQPARDNLTSDGLTMPLEKFVLPKRSSRTFSIHANC